MEPSGTESPLYCMWKARLDAEQVSQAAWAARQAERERNRASWYEAWYTYRARVTESRSPQSHPQWWNAIGWIRWLVRLHAPGGRD